MPTNVIMPQMGESIFEGTLTKWLKKPGDKIQRDEPLFEISTDKVDAEIPSPAAGVLSKVLVQEGQTVQINTVVAEIEEEGAAVPQKAEAPQPQPQKAEAPASEPPPKAAPPAPAPPPPPPPPKAAPPAPPPPPPKAAPAPPPAPAAEEKEDGGGRYSPLVRKLAAEHNLDLSKIQGTGLGGRVTKNDVYAFMESQKGAAPAPTAGPAAPAVAPGAPAPAAPPPAAPAAAAPAGRVEVVPMSTMRQKIAQHMVESRRTSAHVHTVFEVDMTRIVRLREQLKNEFEQRNGVKLTYMPFIARAAISALKAFPYVNSSVDGNNVLLKKDVNLGIAVALDWGLIVPVVKSADEKSFLGLARAIRDVAGRARSKKLSPDEVQGGTFTITNPGQSGALFGTPIISQPQVAILGMGALYKAPLVIDDAIAIRSIIHLSLGYDHRIIDGWVADNFMAHIKKTLENWEEPVQ